MRLFGQELVQAATLAALDRSLAVIEFEMDGTIINATESFHSLAGYTLAEVRGFNHAQFIDPSERESAEYCAFWDNLRQGHYQTGEYS